MSWQKALAEGFSKSKDLLQFLGLPPDLGNQQSEISFKTRVPLSFAERMEQGNPNDPLLLQVLAQSQENDLHPDFNTDPLHEKEANPISGLLHKYQGRVLITLTQACAVHCRYCFRRHFPYEENNPGRHGWTPIFHYISKQPEIHEVILSGGDPMLATDTTFNAFLEQLEQIPHLKTLRIHSRIPVVLPERLTHAWLNRLQASRFNKVMVLHANHPQELDSSVQQACLDLKKAGFHLLNQSVLLKQVNDKLETLIHLSQKLFELSVLPYYLHLLDKVKGAHHFDVDKAQAMILYKGLQKSLPGYLLPKLVKEEPGQPHKTLLVG